MRLFMCLMPVAFCKAGHKWLSLVPRSRPLGINLASHITSCMTLKNLLKRNVPQFFLPKRGIVTEPVP